VGYPPPTSNTQTQFQNPLSQNQMMQFRAQVMAYRILARNQQLPQQVILAAQVRFEDYAFNSLNNTQFLSGEKSG
jgi:hypothetical protein